MAFFIATFCDLPQYSDAIEQNFTGPSLDRLFAASMLRKGLARAGVCDFEHQRQIAEAIGRLDYEEPENLGRELDERVREGRGVLKQKRPRRPAPELHGHGSPGRRKGIDMRVGKNFDRGPWIRSAPRPPETDTATMLRRPVSPGGHSSKVRHTPRPFVKAPPGMPPSARGLHGRRVAYGVLEYETMRDLRLSVAGGDQMPLPPPPGQEVVNADCSLARLVPKAPSVPRPPGQPRPPPVSLSIVGNPSDPESTSAASVIQRRWRNKQNQEKTLAATRIQSSFRGRKAREEVRKLTYGDGTDAAVAGLRGIQKIQSERHAQKEKSEVGKQPQKMLDTVIHALGHDGPESSEEIRKLEESAVKIQSHHRRRTAQAEVDELRAKQREVLERRARGEVDTALSPASPSKKSDGKKEGFLNTDHLTDPEMEMAALKIQAISRGRQSRKQLDQERKHRQQETQSAIKIQAVHRGNQQRKSSLHQGRKSHKSEENQAATKIQSIHRGNQQRKGDQEQRRHREEDRAATKIQAIHRGNQQRKPSGKG